MRVEMLFVGQQITDYEKVGGLSYESLIFALQVIDWGSKIVGFGRLGDQWHPLVGDTAYKIVIPKNAILDAIQYQGWGMIIIGFEQIGGKVQPICRSTGQGHIM
jgi:hypothetical protein